MRLDEVTAEIRPRSDWEAVDLGFAMVRRDFWRCLSIWWLAVLVPTLVAGVLLWRHPVLLLLVFWWWRPAGSRLVLYQISRRLFGEQPAWRALLREVPRAWGRRFFYRFIWARFSPWMPITLAVEDLEGLRGNRYRQRCSQVTRRGEGVVMWLYLLTELAAGWFGLGLLILVLMFVPEGQDGPWAMALESWDFQEPFEIPLLVSRMVVGCLLVTVSVSDLFLTGAGFGIYVNNRTWIEGWDVELAFRRLAQRLGRIAAAVAIMLLALSSTSNAAESRPANEVIQEVKKDPVFKVHTVTEQVPIEPDWDWDFPASLAGLIQTLGHLAVYSGIGLFVFFIFWLVWKFRHLWILKSGGGGAVESRPSARTVMGMDVSPDTLPPDIPGAAWLHWQQGRWQEALGLLYRGAISRIIERERIEIQESDTEGDCMRRVDQAGSAALPDYFRGLTRLWIRLAYAGHRPADSEVEALCKQWPFTERRGA